MEEKLNYRFLSYNKYENFLQDKEDILPDTIVFIKDKRCIWARGNEYAGNLTLDYDEETHTATLKTADGEPIVEFTDKQDYAEFKSQFINFFNREYAPFKADTVSKINLLATAIDNETERATGVESTLQTSITSLDDKVDLTKAELEETINRKINEESQARETADNKIITENIAEETRQRIAGDTALESKINTDIEAERATRSSKDTDIEQRLNEEINTRQQDDSNLSDRITNEVTRSTQIDNNHDTRIATLENLIEADNDHVINKFNEIIAFLNGIEEPETPEGTLANIIETIDNKIETKVSEEEGRADTAETGLREDLDKEISRAKQAEEDLAGNIADAVAAERDRALAAEGDLGTAISQTESTLNAAINTAKDDCKTYTDNETSRAQAAEEDIRNSKQNNLTAGEGISLQNDIISVIDYISESTINAKLKTLQGYLGDLYVLKKDVRTPEDDNWSEPTIFPFGDIPEAPSTETYQRTDIQVYPEDQYNQLVRNNAIRNDVCYFITE